MKLYIVDESMSDQRFDRFLMKLYKVRSKNSIEKWIRKKLVKVNNKKVDASYRLELGDEIKVFLPDDLLEKSLKQAKKISDKISSNAEEELEIVYEDDDILIVNKPAGLLVHPAEGDYSSSLSTLVQRYLASEIKATFSPASISRLDFNTEGLVLFGKNYQSLKYYNTLMREGKIKKLYLAVCEGIIEKEFTVSGYITKEEEKNISKVSKNLISGGKYIKTVIKPIKKIKNNTLIELELITGRTHQIRASMKFAGHPIVGDKKYGSKFYKGISYQALVAYKLILPDKEIKIEPESIKNVISKL